MGKFARKLLSGDEYQIYLRAGGPTPAPKVYLKKMAALFYYRPISLHIESQHSTLTYIPWINILSLFIWHEINNNTSLFIYLFIYCGPQEEPAILISWLFLRMRPLYVASICLDFH